MEASLRVVTELPAAELWDEAGPVQATPQDYMAADSIVELLRQGSVRFVVLEVGLKPEWVESHRTFEFWKQEVRPRLADPGGKIFLNDFPNGYCYFARLWKSQKEEALIALERNH